MAPSYDGELRIWVVGVRKKNKNGSIWGELWKPTSLQWFTNRKTCQKYILDEIPASRKEYLEYRPLRYAPVQGRKF